MAYSNQSITVGAVDLNKVGDGEYAVTPLERILQAHERRAALYAVEMELLSRGGADYRGNEKWNEFMRSISR